MIQYTTRPAVIDCDCGNTVSVQVAEDRLEARHQGRKLVVTGSCEIQITCEKCSRVRTVVLDRSETAVAY